MTTTTTLIGQTTPDAFTHAVDFALAVDARVRDFLSHDVDYSLHRCYLTADGLAGYALSPRGDLQSVFNIGQGGIGDDLISHAVAQGARTLDCFDGYLPRFYARHGFTEACREANWTPGEPDVVFMAQPPIAGTAVQGIPAP